jgi:hypothetical protein
VDLVSAVWGEIKCIQNFGEENGWTETSWNLEALVGGGIILKFFLKKYFGGV